MRYTEPKDRSAELLRQALGYMGPQQAAFNPITFTVWYEHAAGMNARLSAAISALLTDKAGIDDATVLQLYQQHVLPADEGAMQRISTELQRVMSGIAQSAEQAGARAGQFGAQLNGLTEALQSNDLALLGPQIDQTLTETASMKLTADALQQQIIASQQEISQLRKDLDRSRDEALSDPLTGILNRKGFDAGLQALLTQVPHAGRSHCLVLFDIDHFKSINDTHGHVMVDQVLQGVGAVLRQSVKDSDHAAARYGGDEFAMLVSQSTLDACTQFAETVRLHIKAMRIRQRGTQNVLFTVTLSGGVAAVEPGDDATALIARADAALYAAKRAGRDQISNHA